MISCANPGAQYNSYKDEINFAIKRVLDSNWYILGEEVGFFEKEFSDFNSTYHSIGVANGTDALHLALRSLGVGAGDEVITTAHTAVATASAIDLCVDRSMSGNRLLDQNGERGYSIFGHFNTRCPSDSV